MHSQVAGQRGNTALQSQFIDIKVTDASRKVSVKPVGGSSRRQARFGNF